MTTSALLAVSFLAATGSVRAAPSAHAVVDLTAVASTPQATVPTRVYPRPRTMPVDHPAVPNENLGVTPAAPALDTHAQKITPRPIATFDSLQDDGSTDPPDTEGAAGPDHLVTTLNTGIRVQDKLGATKLTSSIESFVSSVAPNKFISDPHVVYDAVGQRFIFTVMYLDPPDYSTGGLVIAASQTTDPTGAWNLYAYPQQDPSFTFIDYPSLGFNKDYVVVTTNNFGTSNVRANVWVVPKADLYAGQAAPALTVFFEDQGYTLVAAETDDPSLPWEYLVEDWNGASSELRLAAVTGTGGVPTYTLGGVVKGSLPWSDGTDSGSFCPQKGTSTRLDGSDGRLMNAVYHDGSLWTAHGIYLTGGPLGSHIAGQWWQIQPGADPTQDVTAVQQGRLDDPSGNLHYAYDSIGVDDAGDVLIGGTRFSAGDYPSSFVAFHAAGDAAGTTRPADIFQKGIDYVSKGGGDTRWGDYSATVSDPAGKTFWSIQEYGAAGGHRWGTGWANVDPLQNNVAPSGGGKGCGCDLAARSALPWLAALLGAGAALIVFARRRASQ